MRSDPSGGYRSGKYPAAGVHRLCVCPQKQAVCFPGIGRRIKSTAFPGIQAVGVFVNEAPETVAGLLNAGIIDIAQLHGQENAAYIARLRGLTARPL